MADEMTPAEMRGRAHALRSAVAKVPPPARAWLIIAAWWAQGALDRIQHGHLTTDPACDHYRAPRSGSWLDRASRGLECEPCMAHRAFVDHECAPLPADHERESNA